MTEPAVCLENVTVRYGDVVALDEFSLRVEPGRICGVIGMNGSGKSTMFKTVMGLITPQHGTVCLHGRGTAEARRAGRLAYVPQNEEVDWQFPVSVADVVMMGRYGHQGKLRRASSADREAVEGALDRVGLADLRNRQIGRLSGGQRKRAFVARAIAQGADVLLLDEPFAGVDRPSEATVIEVLRELASNGATVVVSTHDLHGLPDLADEAALIFRRVLVHGSPETVLQPDNLLLAFGGGAGGDS